MNDWLMLAAVMLPILLILLVIVYLPDEYKGGWVKSSIVVWGFLLHIFVWGAGLIGIPEKFSSLEEPNFSQMDAIYVVFLVVIVGWIIRASGKLRRIQK